MGRLRPYLNLSVRPHHASLRRILVATFDRRSGLLALAVTAACASVGRSTRPPRPCDTAAWQVAALRAPAASLRPVDWRAAPVAVTPVNDGAICARAAAIGRAYRGAAPLRLVVVRAGAWYLAQPPGSAERTYVFDRRVRLRYTVVPS